VNLTREEVENSPEYDPAADVGAVYEIDLAHAEGRPTRHW
jgi:hypothetical protein